ncbi:hypothetical protein A2U01_0068159, partial [Trifolium medium]|nr:hypothetical protein [Trifolium medium]
CSVKRLLVVVMPVFTTPNCSVKRVLVDVMASSNCCGSLNGLIKVFVSRVLRFRGHCVKWIKAPMMVSSSATVSQARVMLEN